MTTRDYCLPFNGKNDLSVIGTSSDCYDNLNLNRKHSCLSAENVHLKDFSNESKKVQNYDVTYDTTQKCKWKPENSFPSLSSLNIYSGPDKIESKDEKVLNNSKNASTLSLHIAAYENFVEATASDSFEGFDQSKEKFNKTLPNVKHKTLSSPINNSFEFPRQQMDDEIDPAFMQYTASQHLLNPNQESFTTPSQRMVINENEFPSLIRQTSTSSAGLGNGHISRTPFNPNGNGAIIPPGTPTAAAITAGLANIPSYGSKDASGSMAGLQRNLYSFMQAPPNNYNEFIRNEQDFPALTPTSNQMPPMIGTPFSLDKDDGKKPSNLQRGIQAHQSGRITNIPPTMVSDQYGMAGVLSFLKSLDKNNGLVQLALGHDLTNLGLNLNSPDRNLYQSFGGPFSDSAVRTQDIECNVPDEYRTSNHIKDKLPPIKLSKLGDDTLFYLFYNCPGEAYQMVAAHELYARDWRYHKSMSVWLTRSAYGNVKEQTVNYEKGSYNIFDPTQWRKIPKEMTLEYKDLEQRPTPLATDFNKPGGGGGNGGGASNLPQQKILTNFSSLNIGATTPTGGPQTPGGSIGGKPL